MNSTRRIDNIVVHHRPEKSMADLERVHRKAGHLRVGYHYGVRSDGTVETGRPLNWPGSFSQTMDRHGIGVALFGEQTEAQYESYRVLAIQLMATFIDAALKEPKDNDTEGTGTTTSGDEGPGQPQEEAVDQPA